MHSHTNHFFAGVDIGSRTAKAVLLNEAGAIEADALIYTGISPAASGKQVLEALLAKQGIAAISDLAFVVVTGYGRVNADYAHKTVTEITCHATGVFRLNPQVHTIIDIGGQDSKVIKLDKVGRVVDFAMNDRCAAGTGKFLEITAHALELELAELGELCKKSHRPCSISSVCAVFAESELVSLLADGQTREDIIAGVHQAVARRVANMAHRLKVEEALVFTGGVANNQGIALALEEELLTEFTPLTFNPQLIGALGAAVLAHEQANTA